MTGESDRRDEMTPLDLSRLTFKFAKTMPETPHEYTVRSLENEADFVALFNAIRRDGVNEKFGSRTNRYWYAGDGWKYWAMTTDVRQSRVINRAKSDDEAPRLPDDGAATIDVDDLEACGLGWRRVDDDEGSVRERRERHAEFKREVTLQSRRDRRQRQAREIATIKAVQKAGLPVKAAIVDGVTLELGQPAPLAPSAPSSAPPPSPREPLDEWDADLAPLTPSLRQ
jgi:hypothetical protein